MTIREKLQLMKKMEADNTARIKEINMDKTLFGVKVDTKNGKMYQFACPNTLDGLRKVLGCEWIEAATRQIGDKPFCVICDEEGRFKANNAVSGVIPRGMTYQVEFVGDIFIVSADVEGDGDMVGLTSDDVAYVLEHGSAKVVINDEIHEVLVCDYLTCD